MKRGVASVLALFAGLFLLSTAWAQDAQPREKIKVNSVDDLPRHTYHVEGKAADFIQSPGFADFVKQVRKDVEDDLAAYDIQDPTTRQGYLSVLQMIAVVQGRLDDSLTLTEQIRQLEGKQAKKLMAGQTLGSYVAAKKAAGDDQAGLQQAFKAELDKRIRALPWGVVKEEVTQARGRSQMLTRQLLLGQLAATIDPVIAQQHGEITNQFAWGLVSIRGVMDVFLDLQPAINETLTAIIDDNNKAADAAPDIWTPSQVELRETDKATPVVVAIWDSGMDTSLFSGRLWTNANERADGKDDDANGFVDDVHGIAFDLYAKPTPELLHSTQGLTSDKAAVTAQMKGYLDVQAGVDSPQAAAFRSFVGGLQADKVKGFIEDLNLFGNYSHGTHVAGIAAAGDPFIRLLPVRITFDYHLTPTITPSVEQAQADAKATRDAVAYMKKAGVRVVNMSWGGSRKDIEGALEQKGVGKTPAERAELSRTLFKIQRDSLEEAIKSAPEILFIAAAGNSDNDNTFSELIPSGLNLPNLITVGAIDQSGKPTSFTTFGGNVKLYANGFEVESYLPGGERIKYSGTSMAAPNTTNLAAKLLALNPKLTTAQVIDLMSRGATPMPGKEGKFIINPRKSVELLQAAR